ncbi:hypothetical protein BCR39DRAFT_181609 [Naematelia encephala]|uniref:Uncharacterized protein n=1 Tax=Naematelia encephala TaxID=71784 RepID=A0A1Y2B3B3_9TREE|nr:hypothetical protein BCR39DRAFT_181609 [Naematelia encephala]
MHPSQTYRDEICIARAYADAFQILTSCHLLIVLILFPGYFMPMLVIAPLNGSCFAPNNNDS